MQKENWSGMERTTYWRYFAFLYQKTGSVAAATMRSSRIRQETTARVDLFGKIHACIQQTSHGTHVLWLNQQLTEHFTLC